MSCTIENGAVYLSFGRPFCDFFVVLFQEHFQKQRIENSMGSSEPTAKQVSYLRTPCSSRCISLLVCRNCIALHLCSLWFCLLLLKPMLLSIRKLSRIRPCLSSRYRTFETWGAPSVRLLAYTHHILSKSTNRSDLVDGIRARTIKLYTLCLCTFCPYYECSVHYCSVVYWIHQGCMIAPNISIFFFFW